MTYFSLCKEIDWCVYEIHCLFLPLDNLQMLPYVYMSKHTFNSHLAVSAQCQKKEVVFIYTIGKQSHVEACSATSYNIMCHF